MNASLVSLNIFVPDNNGNTVLLNQRGVPILFYWNGTDNMYDEFRTNKKFREIVDMSCFNIDMYAKSQIGYFMFNIENDKESYSDEFLDIQSVFTLNELTDTERMFYIEYILNILNSLYKTSMGHDYSGDILSDENGKIIQMYVDIQKKYPNRFVKTTLLNYVRSELSKTYNLHQINCDWIIEKLEDILKEQN